MKNRQLKLGAILLLGLGLTTLQAQESVNATGGNASGSGGSVSYTVGQVVYTTNTGTTGSVASGVQQTYEISTVNGLENAKDISLMVTIYPNPVANNLTLKVENDELSTLSFQLYDMNGKLLEDRKITGIQTSIAMGNLVPATYFLKVVQTKHASPQQVIKSFKIIKTQ
jgi:hypothetical protein